MLSITIVALVLPSACRPREPLPYAGFVDAPVAAIAAQLSGRVVTITVREGDRVVRGQLLAQLESSPYEAAVAQAEANLDRARHALEEAVANESTAAPGVTGARADIARMRASRDDAAIVLRRAQELAGTNAIPQSDLDTARARFREAQASLDATIAARSQSQGRLVGAAAGVENARAAVQSSEAALRLARAQLEQTRVVSPFDGLVVSRNLEEGEWAAPGTPVITMEDTNRPWVRLDIPETQFGGLRIGQAADVHLSGIPARPFRGHIAQIGAEGDFAVNRDVKRGRPDIRTFLVRVAFDEVPEQLRPGMTAEVRLLSRTTTTQPGTRASR